MRHQGFYRLAATLGLAFILSSCGVGHRQNPVGNGEETGSVQVQEDQPTQYLTRSGDTLRSVAARPEIFKDPDLWPLLQEANADALGAQGPTDKLNAGIKLSIPRGDDEETKRQAREKSQQAASASKAPKKPKSVEAPPVAKLSPKPVVKPARPAMRPATRPAKPLAKAPEPAKPVPKARKSGGMLPVLVFLLLLLGALAGVLYWFNRRDREEGAA